MPSTDQDITIVSGDNAEIECTVVDADGTAVNITGYGIVFSVVDATTLIEAFDKDTATGATELEITSGAGGVCVAKIAPADTALLVGSYKYDFEFTEAAGLLRKFTPVISNLKILRDMSV